MKKILNLLEIDEYLTKPVKKPKTYDKVKQNIPHEEDYNFMADLLMLPKTSKGNRYLLVVVDLYTDEFDIEPLKTKTPVEVLKAFKNMFKRPYISKPYASVATDQGGEFMGVFHKYLYNNSIFHKRTRKGRHSQLANVERLNRTLGRLLNGYMNAVELRTKKRFNNWDEKRILDIIRVELNKYRKERNIEIMKDFQYEPPYTSKKGSKYDVGDIVHVKLDVPKDALGNEHNDENFRMGDFRFEHFGRKIKRVLNYDTGYRYLVEGINNASFTDNQLLPSKDKDTKYEVKKIIGKKKINGKINYLIWWKNYPKKEASYVPRDQLIVDGLKDEIKKFEKKKK